jgi:type VII secretion integral membrane protein EccD
VTGVSELRTEQVVSAAPDQVRVSVLGGRTQLDVALPTDVTVAAFLPELAELIGSRDARRDADVADRDERRTFWVLSRIDGGAVLAPNETLRSAGVRNGELLRISARRALSPPMLYDDVVDAAARLNRAAYAAWNPTAAKMMAFAGLWLGAGVWLIFLMSGTLSAHRMVMVIGAAFTTGVLVAGAAVVHRVLGVTDVATVAGWAALAITAAIAWVLAVPYGTVGLAVACAVLLAVAGLYYRVIGTGHWAYVAATVVFAVGGVAVTGHALGGRQDVVAVVATTIATLGCVAMPNLTARLARTPAPRAKKARSADDPFTSPQVADSSAAMPSAEEVWARARALQLTRSGLLAGFGVVVVAGAAVLLHTRTELSAFVFALACASVLALRSRGAPTWPERAAAGVPAVALTMVACALAQSGATPLRLAGVGVLMAIAALATLAGLALGYRRWLSTAAAYLEYAMVAALVPLALWPIGVYDRLGPW